MALDYSKITKLIEKLTFETDTMYDINSSIFSLRIQKKKACIECSYKFRDRFAHHFNKTYSKHPRYRFDIPIILNHSVEYLWYEVKEI